MFLSSWLKLVQHVRRGGKAALRGQRSGLHARKSAHLTLEMLEDRTLMSASTFQWTGASSLTSNWNDPVNWTNLTPGSPEQFPNTVGDIVQFTGTPQASTVLVNQAITVGEIDFGTAANINIGIGGFGLTLDNTGAPGNTAKIVATASNTGSDEIYVPITTNLNNPFTATILGGTLILNNGNGSAPNTFPSGVAPSTNTSLFTVDSGGVLSVAAALNTGTAPVTVNSGGALSVSGSGSLGGTLVTVNSGGTATIDDSHGSPASHLSAGTNLVLNGGTFNYIGNAAGSSDAMGNITLASGDSVIDTIATGTPTAGTIAFTSNQLIRQTGATVNFEGAGLGSAADQIQFTSFNNQITNSQQVTVGNSLNLHIGTLPYASVNSGDFATYQFNNPLDPSITGIGAFNDYAISLSAALPGDTVKLSSNAVLTRNTTVNGIVFASPTVNPIVLGENGFTLTVGTSAQSGGGILEGGAGGGTITGGTVVFGGTGEGIVMAGITNAQAAPTPGLVANWYNVTGEPGTSGANVAAVFPNAPAFGAADRPRPPHQCRVHAHRPQHQLWAHSGQLPQRRLFGT